MSNEQLLKELSSFITTELNLRFDPLMTLLIIVGAVFLIPTGVNVFVAFRLKRKEISNAASIRRGEMEIGFYQEIYAMMSEISNSLYETRVEVLPQIRELRKSAQKNEILLSKKAYGAIDKFCDVTTIATTERSKRSVPDEDKCMKIIKSEFGSI